MKQYAKLSVTVVFALLIATSAFSQGTPVGTISGTVTDASGGALPGATVEITNEEKGYSRTEVTDADGKYRFPLVAVGTYKVVVSLSGFDTVTRQHNIVEAQKTTTVDVPLRLGAIAAEITVTGEVPIVDKTSPASEHRFRKEELETLPVGRGYQAIFGSAPGISSGTASNPTVHGSLSSTNQYQFDGMDVTDTTTGTFGSNLNYEAVQEVMVYTSGISAEYGRVTGGLVNVITKSGSNSPEGSFKYIATNDEWDEQNKAVNQVTGASLERTKFDQINPRYSYTLGGPLWRDRAWFFGAYEESEIVSTTFITPVTEEEYNATRVAEYGNYRLTLQANPRHSFWGKYANDPDTGIIRDYWATGGPTGAVLAGEMEALTAQTQGGDNWGVNWNGIFGSKFAVETLYSELSSVITVGALNQDASIENGSVHVDLTTGFYYNGPTFVGFVDRPRKSFVAAGSYFTQLGDNNHDFKVGFDWQDIKSGSQFGYPNNRYYEDESFDPVTRSFVPAYRYDFDEPVPSISEGNLYAVFLRDKFEIGDRLFMEAGLRLDQQEGTSDVGISTTDSQTISPRLALSYDLVGNGKTLVVGTLGRFYQFLIQSYADSFANVPQQGNFSIFEWNGSEYVQTGRQDAAANNLQPDADISPTYSDELTLGFEQQIGNTIGVGIRGVFKQWNDMIDDVRTVGPTGQLLREWINYDEAEREYMGVEFVFDKRFSNNWSTNLNYTYSEAKGNHFVDFTSSLGDYADVPVCETTDPGISSTPSTRAGAPAGTFMLPCSIVQNGPNKTGLATYDRPHYVKGNANYSLPLGPVNLTLGLVGNWRSGINYTPNRANISVRNPVTGGNVATATYFYEERGSERLPDVFEIDSAIEATWRLWRTLEFGVKAEAFNVTDEQNQINVNSTSFCSSASAPCGSALTTYGKATTRAAFQTPRQYRLTGLIRF